MPTPSAPPSFRHRVLLGLLAVAVLIVPMAAADAVDVLTFHNDNVHSGANTTETTLNQSNVNSSLFGQVAQIPVNGDVFAQPLYVSNMSGVVGATGARNLLIVATEEDKVYCIDADSYVTYWEAQLGTPMARSLVTGDTNYDINIGITSTPVIDKANGFVYVCGMNVDASMVVTHNLWKLNLTSGAVVNSTIITATNFVPEKQGQRPALTLDQSGGRNNIYIAFASFSDQMVYCGYVLSYDAGTLAQKAQFLVCPSAYTSTGQDGGGIWMSGCGPAIDSNGFVYVVTGNGYTDATGLPVTGTPPSPASAAFAITPAPAPALPTFATIPFSKTSAAVGDSLAINGTNFTGTTAVTFANGVTATTFSVNSGGTQITATIPFGAVTGPVQVTTSSGTSTSGDFTIYGLATQLVFITQPPASTALNAAMSPSPQVAFEDGNGVVVASATGIVTLTLAGSGGGLSGGSVAAVGGIATFPALAVNASGTGGTLTAASAGLISPSSSAFAITPTGAPTFAAAPFSPTSAAIGFAIAISGTNFAGTSAVTFANGGSGVSATSFSVNAGGTLLTVTIPAGAVTGPVQVTSPGGTCTAGSFTIFGAATQLAFITQPPATTAVNTAMAPSPQVAIEDGNGVVVASWTGTITLTLSGPGGTLSGGLVTAVGGIATFPALNVSAAGAGFTLVANATSNYGEAIVKLDPNTLTVLDYFSPYNRNTQLNPWDADLGVGGLTLLPPQGGSVTNLVVHDSKQGILYVENRDNLGMFNAVADADVQETNWFGGSLVKATPISWLDPTNTLRVFGAAESANPITSFTLNSSGQLVKSLTSKNLDSSTAVSLTQMALSCNGSPAATGSGILWAMSPTVSDPIHQFGPGILRAYNAETMQEIYNSAQYPQRDTIGYWPKNCAPLVANGKVYCASLTNYTSGLSNMVYVYGPVPVANGLNVAITSPTNPTTTAVEPVSIALSAEATSSSTNVTRIDVYQGTAKVGTIANAAAGSMSGSITLSYVYGGTYTFTALAVDSTGATVLSAPVTVTVPSVGQGTIELQTYLGIANTSVLSALTSDAKFPNSPDSTSFPTLAAGPVNNGINDYGERLIGYVYPPITGNYTFWICSDDQSQLYLSSDETPGKQVPIASVPSWTNYQVWNQYVGLGQQQSVPILLTAGQRYFIQAVHVQGGGGTNLGVAWQIPDGQPSNAPNGLPGTFEGPIVGGHLSPPTLAPLASPPAANSSGAITYTGPITVTLTSALPIPGESIYYTTDGVTTPTTASTLYTGPFLVSISTTIKAVTVLTDGTAGTPAAPGAAVGTITSPVLTTSYTISGSAPYGMPTLPQLSASALNAIITTPPTLLSATGLFSNLPSSTGPVSALAPVAGVLPYNVIAPLWSDGASKDRYIAVPAGSQIIFDPLVEFIYPVNTILIKNFILNGVPLEVRLIMLTGQNSGYGATYKWNAGATDATLMDASIPNYLTNGLDEVEVGGQTWHYPSPTECLACHTNNAGFVLGPKARQLNTSFTYPSTISDNELRTWNYLQLFSTNIGEDYSGISTLYNITDTTSPGTSVQNRVRSYFDSNCAQCHRPGGVDSAWNALYNTPLASEGIINGALNPANTFGILGAEVVYPHILGSSMIYLRMNTTNTLNNGQPTRMPPLARNVVDPNAMPVLSTWISSMAANVPSITTIAPSSGPVGTVVTISGSAFTGTSLVTFTGTATPAAYTVTTDGSMTVTVPSGATSGPITVTSCSLTATSASFTVLPAPTLVSFAPPSGPVGTVVAITGSGLLGTTAVSFGATAAGGITVHSDTSLSATVANGTPLGPVFITVTAPGGSISSATQFTVLPAPTLVSFTPASGPVGTSVTITGSGFIGTTAVSFGATAAGGITVHSDTSLSATVANGTPLGPVFITVTAPGGSISSATQFTVLPAPTLASFTPASGPVGTSVTITGSGFIGTTAVSFGATAAGGITVHSDTSLSATVANGTPLGPVFITVTAPGGSISSATQFTVLPAPTIASFTPGTGPVASTVTITGSGLFTTTAVSFGSFAATSFIINSDTSISAIIANSTPLGAATINVTTLGGNVSSSTQFMVVAGTAISSFTPASGPVGTSVTITGSGFIGTTAVSFGATAAGGITVNSDTSLSATVANGTPLGPVFITVTAPGGSISSATQFTVLPAPTLVSFTPASGPVGTSVTITGSGFIGTTAVSFGATAAGGITVHSDTSLSATVANGTPLGPVFITVTAPGGSISSATQFTVLPAPTLVSFTPASGPVGTSVTITGSGFIGTTAVSFGATAAGGITVHSDTSLSATVANGTPLGPVFITVTAPGGSISSATQFTVLPAPTLVSFTPASGPVGTSVTITGSGFIGTTAVSFGATAAGGITVHSDTSLSATVANGTPLGPVFITVTAPGGSISSATQFTVLPAPTLVSFTPASGPVGTSVTITGSGFIGTTAVSFGATAAGGITVHSDTSLSATVANGTPLGPVFITVTAPGGSISSATQFTVLPAPTLASFTPASGPEGTSVTITGSGFIGTTAVSFGLTAAGGITVNSDTSLSATVANGTPLGPVFITVTAPGGSISSATQFTVLPAPTIASFTPGTGPVASTVTITGSGLFTTTAVSFGSFAATSFIINSDTSISAIIANSTPLGAATINVTTLGGNVSSSTQFMVVAGTAISSFTPASGPVGTSVTITGSGFIGTTAVNFGATAAGGITVNSDTSLSATVANGTPLGPVFITVTAPGGSISSATQFTVLPAPTLVSFTPASGPVGTSVTITGSGFIGTTAVSFGATAAGGITVHSDTSLSATVANGTPLGPVFITVIAPGGSISSATQFTVLPAPTLVSFTPASGPVGTSVTITGSGFIGTTAVSFGATAAGGITVHSDTSLSATVANGTPLGPVFITVTAPGGSISSATQFTVLPAPTLVSFTPASGPVGTSVTITGSGFIGTTAVSFGATAAGGFTVNSDTSLSATVANSTPLGALSISVTAPGGSVSSGTQFTVIPPPPTIASITPGSGPVGAVVTITGTNLSGATVVAFGGIPAVTVVINSATQITATVPAAAGTGVVSVTTPGGTANGTSFTVIPAPLITSLLPNQGSVGTSVEINGTGFTGTTAVSFNGTATTFTVLSDSQIGTTVPVGATTGSIAVTAPGGSATSGIFTVVAAGAPTITSISPAAGAPGSVVIITGTNLGAVSAVSFNGTYASFSVNGAGTQITATIPPGANSGPITVYSPQGNATSPTFFTDTNPQSSTSSSSTSSNSKCGSGIGVLIGLLLMTAVLRRLRLRDHP